MKLKIVTPDRIVLEEDNIVSVSAQTTEGSIGILENHMPLVTPLEVGLLAFASSSNAQKRLLAVMGGLMSTDGKTVTVLSNAAEFSNEIDTLRAEQAKKQAEALLNQSSDRETQLLAEQALVRALTRLKASTSN
jgi:F-type H+-transporting ATPase subunit epsilon